MVVLLTGATGFIGSHLAMALRAAGHEVVCCARSTDYGVLAHCTRAVEADYTVDVTPDAWLARLQGIDVVVNAVGVLVERGAQSFDRLHRDAPRALFAACAQAKVQRVVQISALSADAHARSRYHLSKREADAFLATLPLSWVIVQPSLVFGPGGGSARLFTLLATLPLVPLPGSGEQQLQPIHIDDLTACMLACIEGRAGERRVIPLVGATPRTLRAFLARLREALGLPRARFLHVPMALVRATAELGRMVPGALLDRETLAMLLRGNVAPVDATTDLLGHAPRDVDAFVDRHDAIAWRARAKLDWLLPLLRFAIALVWIATGIVSLGVYPVEDSYRLLARLGVSGALASVMLYGAALLDLVVGIATLAARRRRWLWMFQVGVIATYSLLIAWRLPEYWIHPYGPLTKNLVMLAAIWLLYELDEG
ncbi:MAG TPA: SDR family oxidoreductase [Casimicrobiaceae bacterium]|nr:SDR family oxidoreductase [Casimicrobiaceae bacterium]